MHTSRKTRKQLFFPIGLLSLALLPLFCLAYIDYRLQHVPRAMEVFYPGADLPAVDITNIKRKFVDITLTGNDPENKIKLDFANLEIKRITSGQDTITGVHFHFDSTAKYKSWVRALDICRTEAKIYYVSQGDIWAFNKEHTSNLPVVEVQYFTCGTEFYTKNHTVMLEAELPVWSQLKPFLLSAVLFSFMILLSMLQIRRIIRTLSSWSPSNSLPGLPSSSWTSRVEALPYTVKK